MFDDFDDLPEINSKRDPKEIYTFGLKTPLKAKSHTGSGSLLYEHSLQAGRMALTISETLNIPQQFRHQLRRTAFIAGIFHDLGKAAAGFQEMLQNYRVNGWPASSGGYRHEMLSAVIFISNTINSEKWITDKSSYWAAFLAIIVHHKPYREKHSGKYPKIIKIAQWPGRSAFHKMYAELVLNEDGLKECWNTIIEEIKSDDWGCSLIEEGWIPEELTIPPDADKATALYEKFNQEIAYSSYDKGIINPSDYTKSVNQKTNKFYAYTRAAVTVGDHLSSGNYLFVPAIPQLSRYDIFGKYVPRSFQKRVKLEGSILLRAPTGSGKTEAAQSWIQINQLTNEKRLAKVFFVLPFQASINSMYQRLGDWVGYSEGMIGLQHSRAAQILFGLIEQELYKGNRDQVLHGGRKKVKKYHDPWANFQDIKTIEPDHFSDLLLDDGFVRDTWNTPIKKQLNTAATQMNRLTRENFYPIKVTTPHQLLGAVLQGRGWEVGVQEFEEACFVFDEIHVFDAHLTGLILGMASVLIKEFNAKIMFMSASFPTFLINLIKKYVSEDIPLIELDESQPSDAEVLHKTRHLIEVADKTIVDLISSPEIIESMLQNDSNLLICNTVATAQEVYKHLKAHPSIDSSSVMLFHSRFKMEDRKKKEQQIANIGSSQLQFIVATQVVEVSLDIDLAFGIFEAAPLDAIIQRLGRVNRKGERPLDRHNIIISQPQGYWKYVYDEDITNESIELLKLIESTKVSEMQLVKLIDKLYEKQPWSNRQWADFLRAYGNDNYQNFFQNALPGTFRRWIDDVIVDNSTTDVLFWADEEEYEERHDKEPLRALDLLISARVSKQDYIQKSRYGPKILSRDWTYDPEFGLQKVNK